MSRLNKEVNMIAALQRCLGASQMCTNFYCLKKKKNNNMRLKFEAGWCEFQQDAYVYWLPWYLGVLFNFKFKNKLISFVLFFSKC